MIAKKYLFIQIISHYVKALVASCFALIFIAIFYEALKSFRSIIRNKKFPKISTSKISENINTESNNKSSLDDVEKEIQTNNTFIKAYFM